MAFIQARIDDSDAKKFKLIAKRKGITVSELFRESVESYIKDEKALPLFGCMKGQI